MPTAHDILSEKGTKVHSVSVDSTALQAIQKMNQHRIGAMVVMDADRVAGIFTERDVMQRVVGEQMNAADISVGEVMTRDVVCCSPDASLEEMSEIMRSRRIRHIPICEEDGALVGLISIGDLNAQHATQQSMTIHYLNEYIYGRV
ncbi:MAG: putative signal transduction protein with domain [Phycisphaerales bacterium]|jgi:CBS domain-containing protein|nr:putative signal transduction protein with domain [Phycisphaerales bacterium]MDB5354974.1 putative signal transduction protein with domain [Phycisphaerales bacterium]